MISNFSWLMIILLLYIIKAVVITPIEDKKLYNIYEIRDNVAIAAIKGEIDQYSEEYRFVMDEINFQLYYMKHSYDYSILFKNLFQDQKELKDYYDRTYKLISQYKLLKEAHEKSVDYFVESLKYRTYLFYFIFIQPIYLSISFLIFCLRISDKVISAGKTMRNLNKKIIDFVEKQINLFSLKKELIGEIKSPIYEEKMYRKI